MEAVSTGYERKAERIKKRRRAWLRTLPITQAAGSVSHSLVLLFANTSVLDHLAHPHHLGFYGGGKVARGTAYSLKSGTKKVSLSHLHG